MVTGEPRAIRPEAISDLLNLVASDGKPLLGDWLVERMPVLIAGAPGIGKSWFTMSLGYCIAAGRDYLGWRACAPRAVVVFDGEMRLSTLQKRCRLLEATYGPVGNHFRVLGRHSYCSKKQSFPDLRDSADRMRLLSVLPGTDVLIIDNVNCSFLGGNENDAVFWKDLETFIWECQDRRITPIIVHHTPKSNPTKPSGSSKNERVFEAVVTLLAPDSGTTPGVSASFNLQFGKFRELAPDAKNLSIRLTTSEEETLCWQFSNLEATARSDPEEDLKRQACEMFRGGASLRGIGKLLNRSHSTIQGWVNGAIAEQEEIFTD